MMGESNRDSNCIIMEDGQRITLPSMNALPYRYQGVLGAGASATVEEVMDIVSQKIYARKVIRNVSTYDLAKAQQQFHNEVDIMRRLKQHHHIIRVHASYICGRNLGFILEPVADGGNLADFLHNIRDSGRDANPEEQKLLTRAFGCLAGGLQYIHLQAVRHKDIKPQNILIHQGRIVYTDFGVSYDGNISGQSTTTGKPNGFTRRYCAPEVADWGPRNRKADIFSLGCVYMEILHVLESSILTKELMADNFHVNIDFIMASLVGIVDREDLHCREEMLPLLHVCRLLVKMLQRDPADRPFAQSAFRHFARCGLVKFQGLLLFPSTFLCDNCLIMEDALPEMTTMQITDDSSLDNISRYPLSYTQDILQKSNSMKVSQPSALSGLNTSRIVCGLPQSSVQHSHEDTSLETAAGTNGISLSIPPIPSSYSCIKVISRQLQHLKQ
jgi:serine/threonine protein kinase